ncbi:hypothetical protein HPB52_015892 [Rhipicephalus sanguineus]|uniref:Uncharacterized protein n=1 Tax=Rhipicephalus sanguineus TaxID=34632 RepID=A0A9D4PWM9_RHISA|nr:hypothetical protein HPB52_015892 [Rhipicephalus sanguineus]
MCVFVRAAPASEISNTAILGYLRESRLAHGTQLRRMALSTRNNIERLTECYVDNYFGTDKNNTRALKFMPGALAMRSVLKAFDRPDWDTVRTAWNLLSMSHGEIFHTLVATTVRFKRSPI